MYLQSLQFDKHSQGAYRVARRMSNKFSSWLSMTHCFSLCDSTNILVDDVSSLLGYKHELRYKLIDGRCASSFLNNYKNEALD